jgi:hypothetical protein
MKLTEAKLKQLILEVMGENITVVTAGGFKPPHRGHYEFFKFYLDMPNVNKVVVFSGDKEREGVGLDKTTQLFQLYGLMDHPKFEFRAAKDRPKKAGGSFTNPMMDAMDYAKENPGEIVGFGHSAKEEKYQARFLGATKKLGNTTEVPMAPELGQMSATDFRAALRNGDSIAEFLPDGVDEQSVLALFNA